MIAPCRSFLAAVAYCPRCWTLGNVHSQAERNYIDLYGPVRIRYSKHYCRECCRYFVNPAVAQAVAKGKRYGHKLIAEARRLHKAGMDLARISTLLFVTRGVRVPRSTVHDLVWGAE